ncbi:cytochrome c-type biogenesis protein [Kangiella sp.]|uniref:cytochrome c-type biogenesis protein n=1 Tax=Kangiella sp. TaxID=1920245 RepID=UPI0019AD8586|nr:cytochrome c-type biogenesis protein [Kangiella sp.]MBD3653294.1 cytochrome c-type biogenesis protein CcmH [Kangiella sp.]
MKKLIVIFCALLMVQLAHAVIETYEFDNEEQEKLYYEIINELRCPKCQNQTIADSDAPLSRDLRYIVQQKIKAGETKRQILAYMQERYGDFVLYDPPLQPANYILWFSPLIIFLIILAVVVARVGRREVTSEEDDTDANASPSNDKGE